MGYVVGGGEFNQTGCVPRRILETKSHRKLFNERFCSGPGRADRTSVNGTEMHDENDDVWATKQKLFALQPKKCVITM